MMQLVYFLTEFGVRSQFMENTMRDFSIDSDVNEVLTIPIKSYKSKVTGNTYKIAGNGTTEALFIGNVIQQAEADKFRKPINSHNEIKLFVREGHCMEPIKS